jgi:uncharacterized protein (TIGR00251 family)
VRGVSGPSFYSVAERGVLLRVKAKPRARQDAVLGVRGGQLLVSVRAPAEKGRANEEIIRVIAEALGLPRARVVLKSGGSSPRKVLLVPLEAAAKLPGLVSR